MGIKHAWDTDSYRNTPGHIPSIAEPTLAVPRNLEGTAYVPLYASSEKDLPIASYWLNTTLQTIPAGTYTDSTGTITT